MKEINKIANQSKFNDLQTRLLSAVLLILVEILVILTGPRAIFVELLVIQFIGLYEFVKVGHINVSSFNPFIQAIPYCLAVIITYYMSAATVLQDICPLTLTLHYGIIKYKGFISFCLTLTLLVIFVILLSPGNMHQYISYLGWSLVGNIIITIPINLFVHVSYSSLFWFTIVIILVVANDTAAYFCGRLLGHRIFERPLIELSPNKTIEGFVGAAIITTIIGIFLPLLFNKPFLTCSSVKPFDFHDFCLKPFAFIKRTYKFGGFALKIYPSQFHGMILALFASLIAPFGGFLASGIKRSYGKKDFGDLIPGHGGILDRCDCQFVMATFTYFYLFNIIA